MRKCFYAVALALSISGQAQASPQGDRSQIIAAIRTKMIDPDSLKIISITMYKPLNGIKGACAEINGKNRFGGYTGNQSMNIYFEKGAWRAGSATDALSCDDLRQVYENHAMRQ